MRDGVFLCQTPGSVLMLAAVPWLVNSLHATIDDKSASRDLIRAIFPHGDREEVMRNDLLFYTSLAPPTQEMVEAGYEVSVPKADRGAFFVRKISIGPPHEIPSFPGPRFLSTKACETLLGDDLESIITMFMKQKSRGIRNPDRLRNKTIQRRLPPPPDFSTDVVLPVLEGRLLVASRQAGDEENQHNPQPEFFEDNNVHRIVSDISRQFFVDLLRCSPNGSRYTAGRSIRLAEDDIEAADMTTYQETNFSRLFNASRYRMADKTLWRSTFDKFFPPKGMKASDKAQNYHNTAYYPAWIELAGRCTTESFDEIREVVWNSVFNKLYWVPAAQADRIWFTKPDKRYTDLPKHDCAVPVLNIIINHKNPPTFEEDLLAF